MIAEINSQQEFYQLIQGVVTDFTNISFEPLLQSGMRSLEQQHLGRFGRQVDPEETPWTPLAYETIRRKGHDTILVETGRLKASLTTPKHADGIRQTWDEWPTAGFVFGTEVPYSRFHESGGEILPRRSHIGTNEEWLDAFTEQTADYVLAELMP
jgi:phage gpG-like protein